MKLSRHSILIAVAIVLQILTSCRKELCYNHFRTASVSLTWEREWERDYGTAHASDWDRAIYGFEYQALRPDMPEWVTLVTYSDEEQSESYLSVDGGNVSVDGKSNRSFLLYNGDTEYIVLSDMASLNDARASTTSRSRSSLSYFASVYPELRSTNPPDVLFSAFVEEVPYVEVHEVKDVPIRMQPLVYTYLIRYEFEYGQHHIALARGAIGGMAESVYLRTGATSEEAAIILYDCDLTDYGCEARVRSFGVPGFPDKYYGRAENTRADSPYSLNLEVRLKNGKILEFNCDISDQMAKQPRGGVIRVSGLRIEDDQNLSDSGFDVNVEDWGEHEDIDLPVGVQ